MRMLVFDSTISSSIPKYPDKIKSPDDVLNDVVRCLVGTFAIESHSRGRAGNIISTRASAGNPEN